MGSGPKGRAKLSDVIEIGGEQHKVRQLSAILMSEVPPKDRTVPTKGVAKHGRAIVVGDAAAVVERERTWFGSEATISTVCAKAAQLWIGNSIRNKNGEHLKESSEPDLVFGQFQLTIGRLVYGLYASCDLVEQKEFWQEIVAIISQRNIVWCAGGDFNTVLRVEERQGCSPASRGMDEFCEFVNAVALCEIIFQGKAFTWFGPENKCSRIDRFFVYADWFTRFERLVVINLPRELSDHAPIILVSDNSDSGPKPFRFFYAWLRNPQHVREMECVWNGFKHGEVDALEQLDTKKGGGELDDNDLLHKLDLVSKLWKVS
ncbi:hypothetical protein V6N13_126632 [Hibiscus sabdariffa]